jgi:hypothetical protein
MDKSLRRVHLSLYVKVCGLGSEGIFENSHPF